MKNFDVVEKISKEIDYNSRNWNKEKIDRYLLKYDEKRIIESMTIIHLKDTMPKDLTIEISTMYNCIVGCKFVHRVLCQKVKFFYQLKIIWHK